MTLELISLLTAMFILLVCTGTLLRRLGRVERHLRDLRQDLAGVREAIGLLRGNVAHVEKRLKTLLDKIRVRRTPPQQTD